jgi:hypothetical protein
MLALVLAKIDQLCRGPRSRKGGFHRRLGLADEGDHHSVVGGVSLDVDDARAGGSDCAGDSIDHIAAAAFGKVRYALYEAAHTLPRTTVAPTRFTPT